MDYWNLHLAESGVMFAVDSWMTVHSSPEWPGSHKRGIVKSFLNQCINLIWLGGMYAVKTQGSFLLTPDWLDNLCSMLFNLLFFPFSKAFGYLTALKGAAEDRPWLWAVYVVVLLLPVLLISICLCPRSGPIKVHWFILFLLVFFKHFVGFF